MKRLLGFALAGLLFFGVFSAPAVAAGNIVKVWTQNLYLGADLEPLILAQTGEDPTAAAMEVLAQIAANNFPLRAWRLATEAAFTKPDLIGLQEVVDITVNGANSGPPFVDYLDTILAALAARGQSYIVAATVKNLDITIPFDVTGEGVPDLLRVFDRDVILVREGIEYTKLDGDYTDGGLCGFEIENPAYPVLGDEYLISTQSENEDGTVGDGCNYSIIASVNFPIDTIDILRGFVGVDATVRGKTYRFVNTHLEQSEPASSNSGSAIIQSLQSVELVKTLLAITPDDVTLILVGDFNSSPEDLPIDGITPPYQIIGDAGFADVWDTNPLALFNPNGFTCCQEKDLLNWRSHLDERIDIIFVRDSSFLPRAFVTGRVPIFPLWLPPNWASDHGGVFAKIIFR